MTHMPELIDRQRAITEIESCFCSECDCGKDKSMCGNCEYLYCMDILEQQPTIEPEVRHGLWIPRKAEFGLGTMYECSVCHGMCEHYTHLNYDPSPYCMHCGARMDGGVDNADN